jgi:hypothetical protein
MMQNKTRLQIIDCSATKGYQYYAHMYNICVVEIGTKQNCSDEHKKGEFGPKHQILEDSHTPSKINKTKPTTPNTVLKYIAVSPSNQTELHRG